MSARCALHRRRQQVCGRLPCRAGASALINLIRVFACAACACVCATADPTGPPSPGGTTFSRDVRQSSPSETSVGDLRQRYPSAISDGDRRFIRRALPMQVRTRALAAGAHAAVVAEHFEKGGAGKKPGNQTKPSQTNNAGEQTHHQQTNKLPATQIRRWRRPDFARHIRALWAIRVLQTTEALRVLEGREASDCVPGQARWRWRSR